MAARIKQTMPHELVYNRRAFLAATGGALAAVAAPRALAAPSGNSLGLVVTEGSAADTGMQVLAAGGNAVDAAVATALVGCVVNIAKCGIGGYGGHMVIGLPDGQTTAIDFNSAAPAASRPDMFPLNENGRVIGNVNERGWLAAGVPGTLAGLQLALDRFGTMSFSQVVQPAIRIARDGFALPKPHTFWLDPLQPNVPRDPASARLFSRDGKPLKKGDIYRNPHLADMLQQLADDGSVEAFYRGEIGRRIARAFQENGGVVTADDMASYEAHVVAPLALAWRGYTIATAPLTAGGLTILQALSALKALGWNDLPNDTTRTHAWLEALRIAWADRLALFGDPHCVDVPVERLLSETYAQKSAAKVQAALAERRSVPVSADGGPAGGTFHVSAVDAGGMMVAATLTHGNTFGAQVTVDGLGLVLGHGMSRFDPLPGRPNSIAPGKRPLNNMCPTIVLRDGRPVLALGGTGGRRIVNAVLQALLSYIGDGRPLEEAVGTPRLHTEGGMKLHAEAAAPQADIEYLKQIGYQIQPPLPAYVYAVEKTQPHADPLGVADHEPDDAPSPGMRDPQPTVTKDTMRVR